LQHLEPCRLTLVVNSIMLAFGFVAMVVGGFGMNYNTWMAEESAGTSKVRGCCPHGSEQHFARRGPHAWPGALCMRCSFESAS
jgi:hypothetical protein